MSPASHAAMQMEEPSPQTRNTRCCCPRTSTFVCRLLGNSACLLTAAHWADPSPPRTPGLGAPRSQAQHPDLVCLGVLRLLMSTVCGGPWALCRRIKGTTMSNKVSNSRSTL